MEKSKMMNQSDFERLSQLMADKGVVHEAFELLADLRQSEMVAKQKLVAITDSIVVALAGVTDCEGLKNEYVDWLEAKATAYDRLISMNSVSKHDIKIVLDGHAWYAYRIPFRNLQEDNAGFGATPQIALTALLESELQADGRISDDYL